PQRVRVVDGVEDERLLDRHGRVALDGDGGHAPARCAEPAFLHSWTVSPGWIRATSTPGASSASSSGRPTSAGNVPQWHGTQRFTPRSSSAFAASLGPIV